MKPKQQLRSIAKIRREHLGRYLYELENAYRKITIPYIQSHGFLDFTLGYLQLLGQMDMLDFIKTKVLVERMGISKQAVSRMIKKCEELGYVLRKVDKEDERNKAIGFSDKGVELMTVAAAAIEVAEAEFRKIMGKENFDDLKDLTSRMCVKLNVLAVDAKITAG